MSKSNEPRHESWKRFESVIANHISKWYTEGRDLIEVNTIEELLKIIEGQKPQKQIKIAI